MFGWMGGILVPLTPSDQYSDNLLLTTPYADDKTVAMLSIIVNEYPVENLFLDGDSIDVSHILKYYTIFKEINVFVFFIFSIPVWPGVFMPNWSDYYCDQRVDSLARFVALMHHDARVDGSIPELGSFNTVTKAPNNGSPFQ